MHGPLNVKQDRTLVPMCQSSAFNFMMEGSKVKYFNNMRETAGGGSNDPLPTSCRDLLP